MNNGYYISTLQSDAPVGRVSIPKTIARVTICGALIVAITEDMNWNPPTPEQIKNLKEMLNIDVELIGEENES